MWNVEKELKWRRGIPVDKERERGRHRICSFVWASKFVTGSTELRHGSFMHCAVEIGTR